MGEREGRDLDEKGREPCAEEGQAEDEQDVVEAFGEDVLEAQLKKRTKVAPG